jgi:4-hydroxy-tetrahydrodipicolinate synthase
LLAKDLGADSVLIVTPYYNKPTQEGIYLHFKAIAESSDIPIMIYNVEGRTSKNIQTETLMRIAELPAVCGVKEASGNLSQIMDVVHRISRVKPDFSLMSGDDAYTLPSMLMGGDGIISVVGNLIPLQMKAIVEYARMDIKTSRDLHYQLLPFFKAAFVETNPIPIKAALVHCDIPVGECRLPLSPLSSESRMQLLHCLSKVPLSSFIQQNQSLYFNTSLV